MAWVTTDNIKGNPGVKGDTGSIASASAESVSAHEPAAVVMTGTDAVKHAHFRVPRGLPGMNAVPADEGVAAYIAAVETVTRGVLNESFLNYLVWTGTAYPPRVPSAVNVFIGPVDPGLAMAGDDLWTNPDTATMAEIVAAMLNPSSPLYAATRETLQHEVQNLQVFAGVHPFGTFGTAAPALVGAVQLAKGGTNGLRVSGRIPDGWGSAQVFCRWIHDSATGSDARFNLQFSVSSGAGIEASYQTTANYSSDGRMKLTTMTVGAGVPNAGGRHFNGSITRISDNVGDTISGPVGIVDAWLARTS